MSEARAIDTQRLIGTWRLISAVAASAEGHALPPPYGPEPMGRLVLAENGRMMAVLCDGRDAIPEGEKRVYSSYCGSFRVEEDTLITIVDAAALSERLGSEQRRRLEFRNECLVLIPPRRPDGSQRELFWQMDGPP